MSPALIGLALIEPYTAADWGDLVYRHGAEAVAAACRATGRTPALLRDVRDKLGVGGVVIERGQLMRLALQEKPKPEPGDRACAATSSTVSQGTPTAQPPAAEAAKRARRPRLPRPAGTADSAAGHGNPSPPAPAENKPKPFPRSTAPTPNGSELSGGYFSVARFVEHPPTAHITKARALTSKSLPAVAATHLARAITSPGTAVTPSQETTMSDPLITAMNAALAERGHGSGAALCATLGLAAGSYKNWRNKGSIPETHRAGVQAWIDKPTITAVRVTRTPRQTARARRAAVHRTTLDIESMGDQVEISTADPAHLKTITSLAEALHIPVLEVWQRDGDTMRRVRAVVLS